MRAGRGRLNETSRREGGSWRACRARRWRARWSPVASLCLVFAAAGCGDGGPPQGCPITGGGADGILQRAVEIGSGEPVAASGPCVAFFGASDGRSAARTVIGRGRDAASASRSAIRAWSVVTGSDLADQVWFKLDVVAELLAFQGADRLGPTPSDRERPGSRSARATAFEQAERSLYGVADADFGVGLLADELMAYRLVDVQHRFRLLHYDTFRARNPHRATEQPPAWAWRFRTYSFFLDGSEPDAEAHRLFRGRPAEVQTDAASLDAQAVLAMDYLRRAVGEDGRFLYSFFPVANRVDTSYNMVRHAGAVYAMLELAGRSSGRQSPDAALLAAADRATDYLVGEVRPCPQLRYEPKPDDVPDHHRRHGLCLVEANESKLGGHGLAVLALLQHPDLDAHPERLEVAVGLGERILSVLQPDGRFEPHKVRWSDGTHFRYESEYYPGEAIYALTRLFRVTGERRWLEAARRASDYRVRVRYAPDGGFTDETIPHDHWLAYGLRELAELGPRPWDAAYLRRLGRLIADAQHREIDPPDWAGGFYEPPRAAPTATRAEALGSILTALGGPYGDGPDAAPAEELNTIAEALCHALAFQLRAQYTSARAFDYEEPQRALGGISGSLTDDEIRIDYPQHTSSSLVTAVGLMERGLLSCPARFAVENAP